MLLGSRALRISMSKSAIGKSNNLPDQPSGGNSPVSQSSNASSSSYRHSDGGAVPFQDPYALVPNYLTSQFFGLPRTAVVPINLQEESTKDLIARTVYVSGIDHSLEEDDLIHFFGMAGRVTACRIRGDTDHPTKFAFVEFSDLIGAQNALQCTGCTLAGGTLRVSRSKTAIQSTAPRMAFSKIKNEDKERILRTVYVGQVDLSLSEDDVKNYFSDCGVVTKVALAGDISHPTRFAFVEFTDLASAKKALLKTETIMCGRTIRVRPSKTPIYQAELDGSRKRSREEDGSGNMEVDKRPRY